MNGPKPNPAIAERNKRIVAAYVAGETAKALGERYGLHKQTIIYIVHKAGVPADKSRGYRQQCKLYEARPELRLAHHKRSEEAGRVARLDRLGWADCPPHLHDDYRTLRKYMTAQEARQTLEAYL